MTPNAPLSLSVALDRRVLRRDTQSLVHLVAELAAPARAGAERPPLRLVLALDTSGSMQGEKLRHVVASVDFLAQQLAPGDRLGLVTFSQDARTLMPLSPVDAALLPAVRRVLSRLTAQGGTNVEAGLRLSAELLCSRAARFAAGLLGLEPKESRQAVVLLSDGQPNAGAQSANALGALARELRHTMTVSTLGYGADHAEGVLCAIAEDGAGTYAFVPSPELCRVELARAVGAQTQVVAEGVTLSLEPWRGVTVERVIGGDVTQAALLAGERRVVTYALRVEPCAELGPKTLARLSLNGQEQLVTAHVEEAAGPLDAAAHGLKLLCCATDARAQALKLADALAFDEARAVLERVIDEIRRAPSASSSARLTEALEQLIDDAALMQQRPDPRALSAFRRGQLAAPAPMNSPLLSAAQTNVPNAKLIVVEGSPPTEVQLRAEMVLGRTFDADLQLESGGVSRRHTRIVAADGAFWVNDLGSSNGTRLNGQPIKCERLRDGDLIELGPVKLVYREARLQ
jgi:Ca-activated chloride channel family protein